MQRAVEALRLRGEPLGLEEGCLLLKGVSKLQVGSRPYSLGRETREVLETVPCLSPFLLQRDFSVSLQTSLSLGIPPF